jgi:hypothetical protein
VTTLLWKLQQWARRLGITGLAGLGLLCVALLMQLLQVHALQREADAQQQKLVTLRDAAARAQPVAPPSANPLDALPPTGDAAQQFAELVELAKSHGLPLPRGQYSVATQAGTPLLRWQLVLPLETDYPTLHAFVAAALERMPNLTLDEIKLKRERIEDTELQAELRLSLFIASGVAKGMEARP